MDASARSLHGRQGWAVVSLLLTLATFAFAVEVAVSRTPHGFSVVGCAILAVLATGFGLMRRGLPRIAALVLAVLLLAASVGLVFAEHDPADDVLIAVGVVAVLATARRAFQAHVRWPPAQRPVRPVLFYNPKSGGGKAERFHLADEARSRGIEPIELKRGDDLEQLVRDAVAGGADALAMAGGDGSQAIVAMVAAEHDLPYACIPAGTRNHFALDLGVDRNDVVGALDAFVEGGERRVDLAEVNGQVFVNNVSLGLYADAVQREGYREAKLRTMLDVLPDAVGPDARAPTLYWNDQGSEHSAVAVLVSNNPYRLGRAIGSGTRPNLDRGVLGIAALGTVRPGRHGQPRPGTPLNQWTSQEFEMRSEQRVAAGIDGEAFHLDPPLRFHTRPGALRVRIAPAHPGVSPSVIEPEKTWGLLRALVQVAIRGAPPGDRSPDAPPSGEGRAEAPPASGPPAG